MSYKRCIFFCAGLFFCFCSKAQTGVFDKEHTQQYAYHLFANGQYQLAKNEYSRLYFIEPTNQVFQSRLLQSYLFSNEINGGLVQAKTMYLSDSLFPKQVAFDFARLLFASDYRYRTQVFLQSNPTFLSSEKQFYLGCNYILDWQLDSARKILQENNADVSIAMQNLRTIMLRESSFKPKNKMMAISMSALVPGLGKVYAGAWKDGLAVFIYTSLSAYQSYRGFEKKGAKSFYGWAFATVGTGFYLGNMYGAGKVVRLRREKQQSKIKQEVKNALESSFN